MEEKNIIAIEIGSSKVRGAIGTYSPDGVLTVNAVEEEPLLDWVRNGTVSNVEEVASLVGRIIRKIENRVSPRKVSSVYVGVGGRSFMSLPREVEQTFPEEVEITDKVIERLMNDAALSPYADRDLYEVVPREFTVDKTVVSRPKGTVGRSIRMSANLIVGRPQPKRNIDRLFGEKLKIDVAGYKVRQIALGDAILTNEEKRLGCMLADFGAETTTVSIYKNGRLQYMATLPLGSRNITRDIMNLHIVEERAEDLKCTLGTVNPAAGVQTIGQTDYSDLNNYVVHRAGEIMANVREQIKFAGYKASDLNAGIIVTGGGARLNGFNEGLATMLGMKIRTGSVNVSEVRIPDSRISAAEMADVISVMCAVVKENPQECLSIPVVEQQLEEEPERQEEPQYHPEPVNEPAAPKFEREKAPVKPKRKSWMETFRSKVANLMTEDEDDYDMRDDD